VPRNLRIGERKINVLVAQLAGFDGDGQAVSLGGSGQVA
jgi:hypothetical protein